MRSMLVVLLPVRGGRPTPSRGCACVSSASAAQQNAHEQVYTPEELQLIVEESERGGALRGESGDILRELFEFGDLTASQAMVPRVRVVGHSGRRRPQTSCASIVLANRRTRYVVYDGDLDHIVGMLHVKDLLRRLLQRRAGHGLRRPPRFPVVPETRVAR